MAGRLDFCSFALALAAVMCVHAGANVLNDVFDDSAGTDRDNSERIFPYTGGSRFIQNGILDAQEMRSWGIGLMGLGMVLGAALIATKGIGVLLFGLIGMALGVLYSLPPIQLSYRGLGEFAVGVGFGILPVVGSAWLQSGGLTVESLVLSLPITFWVTAILLINEIPDRHADSAVGRRTLVVRLGVKNTLWLYLMLNGFALAAAITAVTLGILPVPSIVVPALLVLAAAYATRGISKASSSLKRGIEITLMIHGLGGLWMIDWTLAS